MHYKQVIGVQYDLLLLAVATANAAVWKTPFSCDFVDNKKQDLLSAAFLDHRHFKSEDKHIPEKDLAKHFACFSADLKNKFWKSFCQFSKHGNVQVHLSKKDV